MPLVGIWNLGLGPKNPSQLCEHELVHYALKKKENLVNQNQG